MKAAEREPTRVVVRSRRMTLHLVRDGGEACVGYAQELSGPRATCALARQIAAAVIGDAPSEVLLGVWVNSRHRVVGHTEIARGTLNAARFTPRDVLLPALLANAHAICLAHCHPSGEPQPSRADRQVTAALREACRLIGVELLDHVIVAAGGGYYSFREAEAWA